MTEKPAGEWVLINGKRWWLTGDDLAAYRREQQEKREAAEHAKGYRNPWDGI